MELSADTPFVCWQEQQIAQQVTDEARRLPPVLNDRSLFTLAATFGHAGDLSKQRPSGRIAAHYSPTARAAEVALEALVQVPAKPQAGAGRPGSGTQRTPGKPASSSAGAGLAAPAVIAAARLQRAMPGPTAAAGSAGSAAAADVATPAACSGEGALARYHYYVHAGIDDAQVAPYCEEWLHGALRLVPAGPPPHVSQAFYEHLISSSVYEAKADYRAAARRSILHYVLTDADERDRLGLGALQPDLAALAASAGAARPPCQLSAAWVEHVAAAREEVAWSLQTLNPNVLELSRLWHDGGYASSTLVEVGEHELLSQLPVSAPWFIQLQGSCLEAYRTQLWTMWLPKCVDLFRRLAPLPINNDADAYYRAVATLQGNQLRGLVERSLAALLALFRAHPGGQPLDPQGTANTWSCPALFLIDMVVQPDGSLAVSPPLGQVEAQALTLVDEVVGAVAGLPKLPGAASQQVPLGSNPAAAAGANVAAGRAIPTTGPAEEGVELARQELAALFAANAGPPGELCELLARLAEPALALDPHAHAACFLGGAPAPDLDDVAAEVARWRQLAGELRGACADGVRTGLFVVRCAAAKAALAGAADSVADALLAAVAAQAYASNHAANNAYQAMLVELTKAATTTDEVNAFKRYIGQAGSECERLKDVIADNKAREEFLFAHRHPLEQEALDCARGAWAWPRRMPDILKEANNKANLEARAALKAAKETGGSDGAAPPQQAQAAPSAGDSAPGSRTASAPGPAPRAAPAEEAAEPQEAAARAEEAAAAAAPDCAGQGREQGEAEGAGVEAGSAEGGADAA